MTALRKCPIPLLTFVGDAVHRSLVRGVEGGEGAAGRPGWGRLFHHGGWLDEAAVQGVLQVMVGHCEGEKLLSVPVPPVTPQPGGRDAAQRPPSPTHWWVLGTVTSSQVWGQLLLCISTWSPSHVPAESINHQ